VSPNVVISQVYGGGGNVGATYTHDFIEIFNRGTTVVDLNGWSLQYASATGTGNLGSSPTMLTELSGSIAPGRYFLVQEAPGAGGTTPLPAPDIVDATPIAMALGAGKVALATGTAPLGCNGGSTPCSPAQLARIVDLVGYGNANFFEGAAAAPTLSNSTAALRLEGGCTDSDNNGSDFAGGAPDPRNSSTPVHFCGAESAPSVSSTSPSSGAMGVAVNANITINFSEPVDVSGSWYSISCTTSAAHTATQTGGPQSFTLNPNTDFALGETCTVMVLASQVSDQDALDPPDNMASNHSFSFTTEVLVEIHDIQGAGHRSALTGPFTTEGIVTAKTSSSFWIQDPTPDANPATSEGLLVFGSAAAASVLVGDSVRVRGTVTEFRPGGSGGLTNLTTTELTSPSVTKLSSGNALPVPTVIGAGGRIPPTIVIEDDATGDVETSGVFDPATDGIDFYESLEGMRVQINNAVAVGPRNQFGEIPVLADAGAGAGIRTGRGGIVIRSNDFNPERIFVDDVMMATPVVKVRDGFTTSVVGVMDYSFGNFKLLITSPLTPIDGGLMREVSHAPTDHEIVVGTYNVENLNPGSGDAFVRHAQLIVNHLRSPDLLAIEEIQDNDGTANGAGSIVTDASVTWNMLIAAIQSVGGPTYQYRQIDPVDDQDGGVPGGNIRVGFLFRTDRGLQFIDRPGGDATTPALVVDHPSGPRLSVSPGRIDPDNPAWSTPEGVRKPLVGEVMARGKKLFVIVNHWKSKSGDQPLFGRFQPPTRVTEPQRNAEAQVVRDFVDEILAIDPNANVIVLGDLNDFEFSDALTILKDPGDLHALMESLPQSERYSYVFEGNSQTLDQIVISNNLFNHFSFTYDIVHVNSEFPDQASDHEPQVVRFDLRGRPRPKP
jgi:hypothetical protein